MSKKRMHSEKIHIWLLCSIPVLNSVPRKEVGVERDRSQSSNMNCIYVQFKHVFSQMKDYLIRKVVLVVLARRHDVVLIIQKHSGMNSIKEQLVTMLWTGGLRFESAFLSTKTPSRALRPTQIPIQWVSSSNQDVRRSVRAVNGSLVLRLRTDGMLPQFPLYFFMAWIGNIEPLTLPWIKVRQVRLNTCPIIVVFFIAIAILRLTLFIFWRVFVTHDSPENGPASLFVRIVLGKLFWRPCKQDWCPQRTHQLCLMYPTGEVSQNYV
jgi:hypothetical protein